MTLRYRDIPLALHEEEAALKEKVAGELEITVGEFLRFAIVRRSIDARKKPRVLRVFTVEFDVADESALLARQSSNRHLESVIQCPEVSLPRLQTPVRVIVVGMGPAGLFSALRLAESGAQVVLVDMGRPVEERVRDVERFWAGRGLDPLSNVQFGEGGAGTFSDGKLSTRINHPGIRKVLRALVDFGADPVILEQAKPHVGTDRLRKVLIAFRHHLQKLGVDIRFETRLSALEVSGGRVCGAVFNDQHSLSCDGLILAPGNSATGTFRMLEQLGVKLEAKPFAVGLRVEHPVELINHIQYGLGQHPKLPVADYALTYTDPVSGRGVYSFCMCPGGEVINASSEEEGVVVNGMSRRRRDSSRSNSALVVTVGEKDFGSASPLAGLHFQRFWEHEAYIAAGGDHRVPVQNLMSFVDAKPRDVSVTMASQVGETDLVRVLPDFVVQGLRSAMPHFNRKMRGFLTSEATLYGVETRTSSPVRIVRGESGESISHPGLFPAGEGAGYAGGIMSAALDGIKAADAILNKHLARSQA